MSTAVALTSNRDVNVGNVTASLESGLQKHTGVFFWLVCILLSDYIQLYCTIKLCVCVCAVRPWSADGCSSLSRLCSIIRVSGLNRPGVGRRGANAHFPSLDTHTNCKRAPPRNTHFISLPPTTHAYTLTLSLSLSVTQNEKLNFSLNTDTETSTACTLFWHLMGYERK